MPQRQGETVGGGGVRWGGGPPSDAGLFIHVHVMSNNQPELKSMDG